MRLRVAELARHNKGWNLRMLAEKLEVDYQTVLFWNQGRTVPRLPMLLRLCRLLGCQVEDLIPDDSVL